MPLSGFSIDKKDKAIRYLNEYLENRMKVRVYP
jgi:hypothetical protein